MAKTIFNCQMFQFVCSPLTTVKNGHNDSQKKTGQSSDKGAKRRIGCLSLNYNHLRVWCDLGQFATATSQSYVQCLDEIGRASEIRKL